MLTKQELDILKVLEQKGYLHSDDFELTEYDKEDGYKSVDEKLSDEYSSIQREDNFLIIKVGTENIKEVVVFLNEDGVYDYVSNELSKQELDSVIETLSEHTNKLQDILPTWGLVPEDLGDFEAVTIKQAGIVRKKILASIEALAAGSGIGKYRRGDVLMDVTTVAPGQLLVLDSIKYKSTDLIKVTQTFADKFYAVFVNPQNPVELKSKGDEEFVVYPDELTKGEYYVALEPAPTEVAPEVKDVETGMNTSAPVEQTEGTEVAQETATTPEATVTKEVTKTVDEVKEPVKEVKDVKGASIKTADLDYTQDLEAAEQAGDQVTVTTNMGTYTGVLEKENDTYAVYNSNESFVNGEEAISEGFVPLDVTNMDEPFSDPQDGGVDLDTEASFTNFARYEEVDVEDLEDLDEDELFESIMDEQEEEKLFEDFSADAIDEDFEEVFGSHVSIATAFFSEAGNGTSSPDDGSAYDLLDGDRNFSGVNEDMVMASVDEYLNGKVFGLTTFANFAGYLEDIYGISKDASKQLLNDWTMDDNHAIASFISTNAKQDLLN